MNNRLRFSIAFILLFFFMLIARLYFLAVKSNVYYEQMAKANAIKTELLAPVRGQITDRFGQILATNKIGFSIAVKPYLYIKKKNRKKLLDELNFIVQNIPDLNITKLKKAYIKGDSFYNQDYIKVVDFIPFSTILPVFTKLNLQDGIKVQVASGRFYPQGKLASHIIGYISKANLADMEDDEVASLTKYIGRSGIERYYNKFLQGEAGYRKTKVNALNEELSEISYKRPHSMDLSLSIDIRLQKSLSKLFEGDAGSVVVLDVKTGAILAAASFPEYDLNPFVTGISYKEWKELSNDLNKPFTNKFLNGLYPPASIIKMGSALALLSNPSISEYTKFLCDEGLELGGRKFRCWKREGHGWISLKDAIKKSCDIYFYKGALKVGIDKLASVYERLGFGAKTGVDLNNEFIGTVPSPRWKKARFKRPWYQGETLNTVIGQGSFLVTPMQIARYTGLIATGKNIRPHFIKTIDGKVPKTEFVKDNLKLSKHERANLRIIRDAMWEVANEPGGTAYRYMHALPVQVGAKTGTAQVVGISQHEKQRIREEDLAYFSRSHAWFTSYAPFKDPRFVVTLMLEHGGHGGGSAGPLVRKIYLELVKLGYFKKEDLESSK